METHTPQTTFILLMLLTNFFGFVGIKAQSGSAQMSSPVRPQEPPAQQVPGIVQPVEPGINIKPLLQAALAVAPKVIGKPQQNSASNKASSTELSRNVVNQAASKTVANAPKLLAEIGPLNYGNEDPIIYLDYSTMNDEILHRRTANFVYFNANFSHCRHCHKFFNIWKDLAVDIRWWRQVVKLFTINCSEEDNIDMCRRAGVTQFPQVRYYWIMSDSLERDGQRLRILGKSVHAMRHLIMDKVLDSYTEHNKLHKSQQAQSKRIPPGSAISSPAIGGAGFSPSSISSLLSNPLISQIVANSAGPSGLSAIMSGLSAKGSSFGGLISSLGGFQGVGQLVNTLMASSSSKRFTNQPMPNNWPEIEPIEAADTQQLVDTLPLDASKNIGSLLIMETQEFLYTGLETMLDLSPYGNQTYIARVRDERSQLSKNLTKRDDIQAPALIHVAANKEVRLITTAPKYTNDEDLRRLFVRKFERLQIKYPVKRVWSVSGSKSSSNGASASSESQEDEEVLSKSSQVYMNDLTNAVRVSLMEQVFRHPDLSDDQYNALVKYVYTLINYFPFNNEESLKFFKRLHSWLQNQVSPMDIGEYKKQFHDIDEVFQRREWVACRSLSNTKTIPSKGGRRAGSLFENPAQIGKVVSNITRLFRGQQQQTSKLRSLFTVLTNNVSPPGGQSKQAMQNNGSTGSSSSTAAPSGASLRTAADEADSPIERIIKSLTSGSLGSDSSMLKLISAALTGGANGEPSSNTGKSKFAREFPCGLWKLAHVMVVNEYIKDSPRKDVKHIVLHSLYQYMLHFFACPTCGNRVSDVSGEFRLNLDENLLDQADSILLLWKVHNRVSKRLESELRPGLPPKIQFPSETLCAKCREPRAQKDLVSTPNWHEKQVLNFLVHHYRPQSLIIYTNSSFDSSSAGSMMSGHQSLGVLICSSLFMSLILCSANKIHRVEVHL